MGRLNPLSEAMRQDPLGRAQAALADLRKRWAQNGVEPSPVPLVKSDPGQPHGDWLAEPDWMSGWDAFNIFKLQCIDGGPSMARICQVIADQTDRDEGPLNFAIDCLPPNHELLADFLLGSNHWFRALYSLLGIYGVEGIDGWQDYVDELEEWFVYRNHLRLRALDVARNAVGVDWPYKEYSLPEAKQNPVWSFPHALAWIATRDYLALARLGVFYRSENEDELASDGVCIHNTKALGWLQSVLAFAVCRCGAWESYRWEAPRHCTCLSLAWEELVKFNGGLTDETPELVFNVNEGWVSMTWPDGADKIRFLRGDILENWPARSKPRKTPELDCSTGGGEAECRRWLTKQFAADPEKRLSKKDFRALAVATFPGRLSERGFNLRVWPELARTHGRDGAGAKRKS